MGTLNIFFVRYYGVGGGVSVRNGPFHVFVFLFSTFRSLPLDFAKVSVFGHGVVGCFGIIAHESNPNCSLDTSCLLLLFI